MKTETRRIGRKRPRRKDKQRNANVLGVTCGVSETQHSHAIASPGNVAAGEARWRQTQAFQGFLSSNLTTANHREKVTRVSKGTRQLLGVFFSRARALFQARVYSPVAFIPLPPPPPPPPPSFSSRCSLVIAASETYVGIKIVKILAINLLASINHP
ncbi:hypothetical protein E2C01_063267 [Portunus trituberculatus]|uniref:Uncharacterized protein n=1 Tax=Portunus trituberculatus TaxID=210409 RepID=A0A5B7HKC7_PORTR|nr:hypothetical protein [Portunus trituberculatus]